MNNQNKHCIFALLLTPSIFFLVATARSSEANYDGKALSEWLIELRTRPTSAEMLGGTKPKPPNSEDLDQLYRKKRQRDEDAIRQIGTNGIPTLLDMLGATSKNIKKVVTKLQSKQLREDSRSENFDVEDLRSLAVDGFAILGTNAEYAVSQITRLFHNPETRLQAGRALTKIGPSGFAVLTNALSDKDGEVRNNVVWVLGEEGGGDPKVITKLLVQSLKDPDPSVRGNAAEFLAGKDPTLAIPALLDALNDHEYYPRARAASSLGSFGAAARPQFPKILSVYKNVIAGQDQELIKDLGGTLRDTLKKIDPEAAEKTGVK
jgi:HEAT repeat protein